MSWSRSPWVIPVASVLPLAAIVYAFSLGPSADKVAQTQKARSTAALPASDADLVIR